MRLYGDTNKINISWTCEQKMLLTVIYASLWRHKQDRYQLNMWTEKDAAHCKCVSMVTQTKRTSALYVNRKRRCSHSKILNTFLFLYSRNMWAKTHACQKSKQRRPWSDCFRPVWSGTALLNCPDLMCPATSVWIFRTVTVCEQE